MFTGWVRRDCVLLAALLGCAAAALAQEAPGVQVEPEPAAQPVVPPGPGEPPPTAPAELLTPRPVTLEFKARGELGMNAALRDAPGDVTVTRLGAGLGIGIPVRRFAQLDVGLDYEFSHYAFSNATAFVPGIDSPWENIHREVVSLRFSQQQTMRLAWFVGGSIGFSHEEDADLGDSLIGSLYVGARLAMAENLFIGGGVVVWRQLEDDPLIFPLPGLDWWLTERFRLTTAGRLGLTAVYTASEAMTFSLGAEYDLREFRLRDDGPVPDGVGRDRRVPVTAGVSFRPAPRLSLDFTGGAHLWQRYRLLDSGGNTLAEIDARPSPFVGIQVGYRF
jgi:hypothetical protein